MSRRGAGTCVQPIIVRLSRVNIGHARRKEKGRERTIRTQSTPIEPPPRLRLPLNELIEPFSLLVVIPENVKPPQHRPPCHSSEDPRPMSWPVLSSIVNVKVVSVPSIRFRCLQRLYKYLVYYTNKNRKSVTHRLDVEMSIDKDALSSPIWWGNWSSSPSMVCFPYIDELSVGDAYAFEVCVEPFGHFDNVGARCVESPLILCSFSWCQ